MKVQVPFGQINRIGNFRRTSLFERYNIGVDPNDFGAADAIELLYAFTGGAGDFR